MKPATPKELDKFADAVLALKPVQKKKPKKKGKKHGS